MHEKVCIFKLPRKFERPSRFYRPYLQYARLTVKTIVFNSILWVGCFCDKEDAIRTSKMWIMIKIITDLSPCYRTKAVPYVYDSRFPDWSRFRAVSPQITEVTNPAVGCRYLSARPAVSAPAAERRRRLAVATRYRPTARWVAEASVYVLYKQLAQGCTLDTWCYHRRTTGFSLQNQRSDVVEDIENVVFCIHWFLLTAWCVEIYGNSCGTYFTKLTALNNKILRILQNKPHDTSTTDLYRTYCTLPVLKFHEFRLCYAQLFTIKINCQMF